MSKGFHETFLLDGRQAPINLTANRTGKVVKAH
jgi:hypothetical protein